ncbi:MULTISPECIES: type II toxin-antitoxin system RelE/ParE family toxin [Pseudomonas]|uniref:Putative addiction module killer protein n=1 Tax=Pseudomonas moorei TaxID=395599 RepID=A0A1H1J9Y4_9PSED|nr:type II toxin-antitoxin system RelE/ParE family toxin [Pseudomonas moorei]KAB0494940.1 type II toxin-antitoxin system RelE/ParE family toxin [Pseudomonas moorei]MBH8609521.1 type II toxin-antitoxin system RelE/ParE family toxin [Pseudomonas mohnii]SDR46795.1 putative addiction module killer protein [Pseudomonas moorei]
MITLEEYLQDNETSPFGRWFSTLNAQAALKVSNALLRLELGNTSNIKWFEGLGEYRINWGPGYRIYLVQEGKRLIILLGGGDKSTQKTDIKQAKILIAEFRTRKKAQRNRR